MSKTLELIFTTSEGKNASISIADPKEPVDINEVKQAMDAITSANIFMTGSGDLAARKGARLIDRSVEEYEFN
ncbi:DUF2922 domain-containing protein [Peribacillus kribbensis]|uniref:DUF2922 domain-containing protein n=1 Tax=Peribacillus kribbensis TaxID=356658 RepID=UPI0003FE3423|nr:DUF2922 domain-containing protein [Peribacillus kribbensis]